MAMSEWADRLGGLSGEDLKCGLDNYRGEWPPTCEQFRNACLKAAAVDHEHARMYRRFPKALPKPKANPEVVSEALKTIRMRPQMTPEEIDAELAKLRAGA